MKIIFLVALICSCLHGSDLHKAVKQGKESDAHILIRNTNSQDLNTLDHEGLAPLHLAVIYNQMSIAKELLESKADFNLATKQGETPIILAFKLKNYQILKMFQEMGLILEGNLFYNYLHGKVKIIQPVFKSISNKNHVFKNKILNAKIHNFLVYTYGLFYTDAEFYDILLLTSKENADNKKLITNILRELALEKFPSGLPSTKDLEALSNLITEVEAAPHLRLKLWKSIEQIAQLPEPLGYNSPLKIMALTDFAFRPQLIAEAITEVSEYFLQAITLNETMAWLQDNKKGASLQAAAQFSKRLINWMAYQVVSIPDEKIQRAMVKKIAKVGQEFLKLRNFWGVAQIVSVLNRPDMHRLKCCKHKKKLGSEISKLAELIGPENNYAVYRSTILEESKQRDVFPNIDVIFSDLAAIFEMRTEEFEDEWLQQMASMFKNLIGYKKQAKLVTTKNKLLTAFFLNIPMIPDDVIEAYSDLQNPWNAFKNRTSRWSEKKLDAWNCNDLYSYLGSKNLLPCFMPLLEAGIWDGPQIIENIFYHTKSSSERVNILIENGVPLDLAHKLEINLFFVR